MLTAAQLMTADITAESVCQLLRHLCSHWQVSELVRCINCSANSPFYTFRRDQMNTEFMFHAAVSFEDSLTLLHEKTGAV